MIDNIQKYNTGKVCQYCDKETKLVDSVVIYGRSYGMIYLCASCDAYCGVHKGTDKALGVVANRDLREAKKEAHKYFDVLWKEKHFSRSEAYKWLAEKLNIKRELVHIGMFDIQDCEKTVYESKFLLNDLRRLDMDFGIQVNREHYYL